MFKKERIFQVHLFLTRHNT